MVRHVAAAFFLLALCAVGGGSAGASQIFTDDTGKDCAYCHLGAPQDLKFTPEGEAFIKNYNKLPEGGGISPAGFKGALMKKTKRLLLVVHGVAGIALLGALIFTALVPVHRVEEDDVPADLRKYLWISLAIAGLAGAALIPFSIASGQKWDTVFGVLLALKAALFAVLAVLVAFAMMTAGKIAAARKRVEEEFATGDLAKFGPFSPADLKMFTGRGGRRALFAFKGKVYDATGNAHWAFGAHFGKHSAGHDLTDEIRMAPHSESALSQVKEVGTHDAQARQSGAPSMRELRGLVERYYGLVKVSAGVAVGLAAIVALWRQG